MLVDMEVDPQGRRVYPPGEVQARLEVSASGLRRLAQIYERTVGSLPRDERGRMWPEEAIEQLEHARTMVRQQRAVSIEAALRGKEGPEEGGVPETAPLAARGNLARSEDDLAAAVIEELRALRELVEEQNHRIAELEETVRTTRELEAPSEPERPNVAYPPSVPFELPDPPVEERSLWQRVAGWFGFGEARP